MGLVTSPHACTPRTHSQWVVGPGRTPDQTRGRGWESARPRTPRTQARGAPPRAPSCRPHSAQSQHTVRAVRLVTLPHARTPRTQSQWVLGPGRTPERMSGRGWESARLRTPQAKARGALPGHPHAPPQRAKPARKDARCGVGDGSPRPHPPHPQPGGSGPRPHARKDEWSGLGERPTPGARHPGKRRPPPGALVPPPQRAERALKSARGGVDAGFPRPQPPHPQPVGSGPRRHAPNDGRSGVQARGTPRAPSCRPHSAQSQLARARAVGLVTGPHARTPRSHSQWVVGPGRTPERTSGRGWESARTRAPHTQARGAPPPRPHAPKDGRSGVVERPIRGAQATGAPPGHPRAAPTARRARSQEGARWGRRRVPTPAAPAPTASG